MNRQIAEEFLEGVQHLTDKQIQWLCREGLKMLSNYPDGDKMSEKDRDKFFENYKTVHDKCRNSEHGRNVWQGVVEIVEDTFDFDITKAETERRILRQEQDLYGRA